MKGTNQRSMGKEAALSTLAAELDEQALKAALNAFWNFRSAGTDDEHVEDAIQAYLTAINQGE